MLVAKGVAQTNDIGILNSLYYDLVGAYSVLYRRRGREDEKPVNNVLKLMAQASVMYSARGDMDYAVDLKASKILLKFVTARGYKDLETLLEDLHAVNDRNKTFYQALYELGLPYNVFVEHNKTSLNRVVGKRRRLVHQSITSFFRSLLTIHLAFR